MVKFLVYISIAALFVGCGADSTGDKTFAEMKDEDVVLEVNGEPMRWKDVKDRLNYEYMMFCRRNARRMKSGEESRFSGFRARRLKPVISEMLNARLFVQAARKIGIEISREELMRECQAAFKQLKEEDAFAVVENISDLVKLLGVSLEYFEEQVRLDCYRRDFLQQFDPRITNITEKVLQEGRENMRKHNVEMSARCKSNLEKLEKIKDEIQKGLDFDEAGKKYGEVLVHQSKFWDSFNYEDMDHEPEIRNWAFSAKVGDIGGPFDCKDGYSIVRLNDKDEGALRASAVTLKLARVYLSRITLRAYITYPELDDAAERLKMQEGFRKIAQRKNLQKFHEEMRIHYPCGTNISARLPEWFGSLPDFLTK